MNKKLKQLEKLLQSFLFLAIAFFVSHIFGGCFGIPGFIFYVFGSFFASLLMPIFLREYGAGVAFGIPGILMGLATLLFWIVLHQISSVWLDVALRPEVRAALEKSMDDQKALRAHDPPDHG